ncbi:MAG: hypothetical protein IPK80_15900 [Nannocystis sp.]|nr:hypothetical protein [Nannocystis sp.]
MQTREDEINRALEDSITRERDACIRAQRLTFAVVALGAGVTGYAAGVYMTYKFMERREGDEV